MKRFFALMLTAMLLIAAVSSAFAASVGKPRFYIEAPSSAKAGEIITVKVNISGEYAAHLLTLHLKYDSCFEYISLTRGEVLSAASEGGMAICEKAEGESKISLGVLYANDEGLCAVGNLFEVTFKVLNSSSSKGEFKLEVPEFGFMPLTATSSTPIDCTVEGASVALSGSGGTQPTSAPTASPAIPGTTDNPGNTETSDATAAPRSTEPAGSDKPDDSVAETTESADEPVDPDDPDSTAKAEDKPADGGEKSNSTEAPEEGDPSEGSDDKTENKALKAAVIAAGVLLAAGLGWLCVHFFKKGLAAHKEASGK